MEQLQAGYEKLRKEKETAEREGNWNAVERLEGFMAKISRNILDAIALN